MNPYLIEGIDQSKYGHVPDIWVKGYGDAPTSNVGSLDLSAVYNGAASVIANGDRFGTGSALRLPSNAYSPLRFSDTDKLKADTATVEMWAKISKWTYKFAPLTVGLAYNNYTAIPWFDTSTDDMTMHRGMAVVKHKPIKPADLFGTGAWHHYAIVYNIQSVVDVFIDGERVLSGMNNNAIPLSTVSFISICNNIGFSIDVNDYRYYKNYAKYANNFIPV